MKRSLTRWIPLFLAIILTATPMLADATARAALHEAVAAGRKWQADAVLTHVSTLTAKADGTSRAWLYTFYSPKTKKSAIVTTRDMKVEIEPDVRTTSTDPVGDFMDSDKALDAARKHGLKASGSIGMGLALMGKSGGQPRLLWSITVMEAGILSWSIDSKDGSLFRKSETKLP